MMKTEKKVSGRKIFLRLLAYGCMKKEIGCSLQIDQLGKYNFFKS